jgi:branched-chain amino acid transport system ATP-binding protein
LEENKILLRVEDIHTYYGKSHILQGVSLEVRCRGIVVLMGRNGVGKSTTLKSIMGFAPPRSGFIRFGDLEITGCRPHEICQMGIGYVPEERRIFHNLTLRQNLLIGIKPRQRGEHPWTIERVYSYFPRLKQLDGQRGSHLSGGEQQMLTIGRTLMGNPSLLLVDEPMEGLAPLLVEMVVKILRDINEEGVSILLVEQATSVARNLGGDAYVLSKGRVVFRGTAEALLADEIVRKNYLEV